MATTREILKQTGLDDATIDALDSKIVGAFDTVLTTASTAEANARAEQEKAANERRLMDAQYQNDIVPALNSWGTEKSVMQAEIEFYRKQLEGAKTNGFIMKDAPTYQPPAASAPQLGQPGYTAGGNPVPGSPGFTADQMLQGVSNATWFMQEHLRLHGSVPEQDFMSVLKEANAQRMDFRDYVDRKYKFGEKRAEIAANRQKEHDDKIRQEAIDANNKQWAERVGNNPMVRTGVPSTYDKVRAATKAGQLKDPLMMTPEQRRSQTRQSIQAEIAEQPIGANG